MSASSLAGRSVLNPFVNRTLVLPWHQVLKIFVTSITLFPIRGVLIFVLIIFATFISVFGTLGMRPAAYDAPLPLWRAMILSPLRPIIRIALFVAGVWVTVRGHPAPKSVAPIVACNHRTFIDPMFLIASLGGSAVAAVENASRPFIGSILVALQNILVHRDKRAPPPASVRRFGAGIANLPAAGATSPPLPTGSAADATDTDDAEAHAAEGDESPLLARARRRRGHSAAHGGSNAVAKITERALDARFGRVLVFPEGTCSNGEAVLLFRAGAFRPGLPVQPVAVDYPWRFSDVSWCGDELSLGHHVCRILCQVYTPMTVTYLPVVTPTPAERADASLYAANVQAFIARALGVPATANSFDDFLLYRAARAAGCPPEVGLVELQHLRHSSHISVEVAERYLQVFVSADPVRSGRLSEAQFVTLFLAARDHVALKTAEVSSLELTLRCFFSVLTGANGELSFADFLVGLCRLYERSHEGCRADALRLMFKIIDPSGREGVSLERFRRLLLGAWPDVLVAVVDASFSSADADRDGLLDETEFVAWGCAATAFFGNPSEPFASVDLGALRRALTGVARESDLLCTRSRSVAAASAADTAAAVSDRLQASDYEDADSRRDTSAGTRRKGAAKH